MSRISAFVACASVLALGACTVAPPSGPSVPVMPGPGKSLTQFNQDDLSCRNYANTQTNGVQPQQAANQAAVGSAVVGTGLGAAAGALIGAASGNAGAGAAIGAGAGLIGGSAVGANNAQAAAGNLQERYDIAYQQCMASSGNSVPPPAPVAYGAPAGYYGPGPYYGPAYVGPGYYGGPEFFIGVDGRRHRRW
jgi:hypothetical protein